MMEMKGRGVPFLFGLVIGILAFLIFLLLFGVESISSSKNEDNREVVDNENQTLYQGWKSVDLKSAQKFIIDKGVKVVTFIDEKGGFYVANIDGIEIKGWCHREGTQVPDKDECQDLKAEKITNFNELITFTTEASPGCLNMILGGYSVPCANKK
jgi:hypothetical protein